MAGLASEFLFEVNLDLEPSQVVGATPNGDRRIRYFKGGGFSGPKLHGEVLPGGRRARRPARRRRITDRWPGLILSGGGERTAMDLPFRLRAGSRLVPVARILGLGGDDPMNG
jgi:hypothetical protein